MWFADDNALWEPLEAESGSKILYTSTNNAHFNKQIIHESLGQQMHWTIFR